MSNAAQISDWPESYVEIVVEEELEDASEAELLAHLVECHAGMRFGRHIDLNIQEGFYFEPGNGVVDRPQGSGVGHLIEVLDHVGDGINIHLDGDMSWPSFHGAHWYVDRADEKVRWVFSEATGPWLLTAEYHERKGEEFYFLIVRFLCAADSAAFGAAFPEADR